MAGLASSSTLSSISNFRTSWLVETHSGRTMPGKPLRRRNLNIKAEVNYVNAEEAKKLIAGEGYTILDVRDKSQYDRAHIKSCYHVPLFVENQDNDFGTIIKRTVHNNFAGKYLASGRSCWLLKGEESGGAKKFFLHCYVRRDKTVHHELETGSVSFSMSRSSAAANSLDQAGFQTIACITSGLQTVKPGTFDSVGTTELQDAGKAGLITIQGKISAVLGTVLVCAYLFITFFPEQAEKLLQFAPTS